MYSDRLFFGVPRGAGVCAKPKRNWYNADDRRTIYRLPRAVSTDCHLGDFRNLCCHHGRTVVRRRSVRQLSPHPSRSRDRSRISLRHNVHQRSPTSVIRDRATSAPNDRPACKVSWQRLTHLPIQAERELAEKSAWPRSVSSVHTLEEHGSIARIPASSNA